MDKPKVVPLRLARVVFGVSVSPFLLNATIRCHLEKFMLTLKSRILQSLYVDDLVSGAGSEEEAHDLFKMSKEMLV